MHARVHAFLEPHRKSIDGPPHHDRRDRAAIDAAFDRAAGARRIGIDQPGAGNRDIGEPREMRPAVLAQQHRLIAIEALRLALARLLDADEADHGEDERVVEAPGQSQSAIGDVLAAQMQDEGIGDGRERDDEGTAIEPQQRPFDETPVAIAAFRGDLEFVPFGLNRPAATALSTAGAAISCETSVIIASERPRDSQAMLRPCQT